MIQDEEPGRRKVGRPRKKLRTVPVSSRITEADFEQLVRESIKTRRSLSRLIAERIRAGKRREPLES